MDLHLTGKVAVVTGGTAGIGEACAAAFLQEGCRVAICGRSQEKLDAFKAAMKAAGHELLACVADVSNEQELEVFAQQVYDKYGTINIWVNNAGISHKAKLSEMSATDWDSVMAINLKSVFLGANIAAKYMQKAKGGVILNASSYAAVIPSAGGGAYAASKAAVSSLTRTLAAELAPYHIRVNGYIPGVIETQMNTRRLAEQPAETLGQIALNRAGHAKEVAAGIVFLASDAASYITGTDLEISGGKFAVQIPGDPWRW